MILNLEILVIESGLHALVKGNSCRPRSRRSSGLAAFS